MNSPKAYNHKLACFRYGSKCWRHYAPTLVVCYLRGGIYVARGVVCYPDCGILTFCTRKRLSFYTVLLLMNEIVVHIFRWSKSVSKINRIWESLK